MGVAGATVPDGFVTDAIFLFTKGETDESGSHEVSVGARHGIERAGADPEAEIPQAEEGTSRGMARFAEILARAKQEEEAKDEAAFRRSGRRDAVFPAWRAPTLGTQPAGATA